MYDVVILISYVLVYRRSASSSARCICDCSAIFIGSKNVAESIWLKLIALFLYIHVVVLFATVLHFAML